MELINESFIINQRQQIFDRIDKISFDQLNFVKNLEEWRQESHRIINEFCDLKRNEYIKKAKEEMNDLKETINSFSFDGDASLDYIQWIQTTIQLIQQQLNQLQLIQFQFCSLKLDQSFICIPLKIIDSINDPPSPFKDLSSCFQFDSIELINEQTISVPSDHWYSLGSNQQFLLISAKSELILFDHCLNILKKKSFIQIGLKDICWSTSLAKFVLIFPKEILVVNPNNFSFESTSIISTNENPWERGTINQSILFLSTFGENPLIVEYNLIPSIHFNKRYQSSLFICQHETINDLKSNDHSLGLIIENSFSNLTRLDIRLIKSFDCIHSIELGKGWGYRCSSFNHRQWIITDYYNQTIYFINNQTKITNIKNCSNKSFNVIYLGLNQFIIRNKQSIQLFKIKK